MHKFVGTCLKASFENAEMKEFLAFKEVYFPLGHMYHYISGCPPRASWTLDGLIYLIAWFWLTVRNQEQGIFQ